MDGWYNVDLAEIRTCPSNEQVPFPPYEHERGLEPPALFIGSEMFAGFKHLNRRSIELQRKCHGGAEVHVFPGTVHWSFIDYWAVVIPTLSQIGFLGRRICGRCTRRRWRWRATLWSVCAREMRRCAVSGSWRYTVYWASVAP